MTTEPALISSTKPITETNRSCTEKNRYHEMSIPSVFSCRQEFVIALIGSRINILSLFFICRFCHFSQIHSFVHSVSRKCITIYHFHFCILYEAYLSSIRSFFPIITKWNHTSTDSLGLNLLGRVDVVSRKSLPVLSVTLQKNSSFEVSNLRHLQIFIRKQFFYE